MALLEIPVNYFAGDNNPAALEVSVIQPESANDYFWPFQEHDILFCFGRIGTPFVQLQSVNDYQSRSVPSSTFVTEDDLCVFGPLLARHWAQDDGSVLVSVLCDLGDMELSVMRGAR